MNSLDLIKQKKFILAQEEKAWIEKRKFEIAQLAQNCGLLNLSNDEIKSAFTQLSYKRHSLENQD